MNNEQFVLIKSYQNKDNVYIDYKNLVGFKLKPKNGKKYGGVNVNEMVIIKPDFIDLILKRKIGKKLESYINYLIEILEDDDTDGSKLAQTLNDIDRYRTTINNTYRQYLNERYLEILLKKLKLVEEKLNEKMQLFYQKMQRQIEEKIRQEQIAYEREEEKTSHRSR